MHAGTEQAQPAGADVHMVDQQASAGTAADPMPDVAMPNVMASAASTAADPIPGVAIADIAAAAAAAAEPPPDVAMPEVAPAAAAAVRHPATADAQKMDVPAPAVADAGAIAAAAGQPPDADVHMTDASALSPDKVSLLALPCSLSTLLSCFGLCSWLELECQSAKVARGPCSRA